MSRRTRSGTPVAALLAMATAAAMSLPARAAPGVAPEPGAGELQLAWLGHDGQLHTTVLNPQGQALAQPQRPLDATQQVPLGSLWKLVAYARLADDQPTEGDYVCKGQHKDEVYCCNSGQRINRGTALWRSCGLYFQPERIGWGQRPLGPTLDALPPSLQGLQQAAQLHSRHTVPLADWLNWLASWPATTQQAARDDLLAYWLQGPGHAQLSAVGSRLRLKTFTLERQDQGAQAERWAGASGWLSDGRALWLAARGSSKQVLPQWAPLALRHIDKVEAPRPAAPHPQAPCVDVHYLQRYPIAQVLDAQGRVLPAQASPQALPRGPYRLQLHNGREVQARSDQDLRWQSGPDGQGMLLGRLTLDEYVARVIDREGGAQHRAAAQALGLAARTYVLAHAQARAGCLWIADSSARQRVAPRPASAPARLASTDTADLVLQGSVGQYHTSQASPGVMAWQQALTQAQNGLGFAAILQSAYPRASLASLYGPQGQQCEPLPLAQAWLVRQLPRWRRQLQGQAGYTPVRQAQVCRLQLGLPRAHQASQRLYVRGAHSLDERLTIAHEYLHLAFAGHPRGSQEAFIEGQARALLGVD